MREAQRELERFLEKKGTPFSLLLLEIARTRFVDGAESGAHRRAVGKFADLLGETLMLADLYGRKRVWSETDAVKRAGRRGRFAHVPEQPASPIVPSVPFDEAVERILEVEPRLAPSMRAVQQLYNTERVFALARSSDLEITKRVQKEVGALLQAGKSHADVENSILEMGRSADMGAVRDWTRAYASTVYRTNASTAYNTGRFEQALDPDVQEIVPAMEYLAQLDDRTRPNHAAAHGLIAPQDDPIWKRYAPPLGYQCRCVAEFVSRFDLERRGLLKNGRIVSRFPADFMNAHPDPGFGARTFDFRSAR